MPGGFIHRISPGTIVYSDATSLAVLPQEYGYRPAVLVLARVVSRPRPGIVTCDAGHKTVSADAGVPTCVVVGHPELTPLSPSEEHLPLEVEGGAAGPEVGEALYPLAATHLSHGQQFRRCATGAERRDRVSGEECPRGGARCPCFERRDIAIIDSRPERIKLLIACTRFTPTGLNEMMSLQDSARIFS